ncbi:hypothetical protein T484DRAFT_1829842 [Baffinella frigidus]|nr:hypothetical protein T484DRAFT_1829842 [Cryptophyta sp. CCMP2293]
MRPRLFFRYWKPRGVLSTTLPVKDGVNIYGEGLAGGGDAISAHMLDKYVIPIGRLDKEYVVPIGRLDKESHGLLLLTTEASLTGRLLRPAGAEGSVEKEYHVCTNRRIRDEEAQGSEEKEYHVSTHRRVRDDEVHRLQEGMDIRVRGRYP